MRAFAAKQGGALNKQLTHLVMELLVRTCHPGAIAYKHGRLLWLPERTWASLAHDPGQSGSGSELVALA